jgi:regulator of protease activity HflC (stomatin/prohibitin superfamily)
MILVAEGNKESAVLNAEAEKEAAILRAEAEKEKKIKEAEGQAEAIRAVQRATADGIRYIKEAGADQAVLQLKSLEAFQAAADGKANKIIIPSDIQGIAGLVKSISEIAAKEDTKSEAFSFLVILSVLLNNCPILFSVSLIVIKNSL